MTSQFDPKHPVEMGTSASAPTAAEMAEEMKRQRVRDAAPELLAACQAQHRAIDILMAMLIEAKAGFMPTQSVVWPSVIAGSAAIEKATGGVS